MARVSEGNETVALMVTVAVKVVLSVMMAKMEKASTVLAREALAKMAEWRRLERFWRGLRQGWTR